MATERTSRNLTRVHELLKEAKARTSRQPDQTARLGRAKAYAAKAELTADQAKESDQVQISALLAAIDADTDAVLADFASMRQPLQAQGVSAEILARHDQAQGELEKRAGELRELIRAWRQAPGAATLAALHAYFQRYPAARAIAPVDPGKLPWRSPQPNQRPPAENKTAWFQNLHGKQQVKLAQAGGGVGVRARSARGACGGFRLRLARGGHPLAYRGP
ncbi:hypothetical protein [Acidovorax sp. SUPP3334]|uniref:hypothetical protein n=1 Tax=Acidovorax sp. SUPP3334 TaxID=2920881 RepID=UPI0023DE1E81|nr:hypothetical protein [Acidovorax sp. SUPP3334]GKT20369.1 hypothetical protein AVHM3334_00710 [Acidovorax sp. SUPP3334]